MSADTREDHAEIWLQPECCAGYEGRLWCEHDEPVECDEGESWTKYVRADRLERTEALLREAVELLDESSDAHADLKVLDEMSWTRQDEDERARAIAFLARPEIRELLLEDDDADH